MNITIARLASVFGGIVEPRLIGKDDGKINGVMWLGSGICIISLIAGVLLVLLDLYAEKKD